MTFPLVFHPSVQGDIDAAYRWYEQQRAGLGDEFLAELDVVFRRLEKMPQIHQFVRGDVRRALLRRFPFAVFYRIHSDRVEIIAVHDCRRDPAIWQSRV